MAKLKDLRNQTFGDLTVIDLYPQSSSHGRYWLCRCTCGLETVVLGNHLRSGHTRSCGAVKEHNNRLYSNIYKKQQEGLEKSGSS